MLVYSIKESLALSFSSSVVFQKCRVPEITQAFIRYIYHSHALVDMGMLSLQAVHVCELMPDMVIQCSYCDANNAPTMHPLSHCLGTKYHAASHAFFLAEYASRSGA